MKKLGAFLALPIMAGAVLLMPARGSAAPLCTELQHTSCSPRWSTTPCEADWGEELSCTCSGTVSGPWVWECPI
jgi:hypothetical protein